MALIQNKKSIIATHCFVCLYVFSHAVCQVQELHRKLSEETRRADNLAFEMKKLEEKHETVMKEKEVWQLLNCVRRIFVFTPAVVKILR